MRIVDCFSPSDVAVPQPPARTRNRLEIPDRFKWNLEDIFPSWEEWEDAYKPPREGHRAVCRDQRHADQGPDRAAQGVPALRAPGPAGVSRVVFPVACDTTRTSATTPSTRAASRCRLLFARWKQAESWFNPELLQHPDRDGARLDGSASNRCGCTSFAIEDLYRQQEHVLDEAGER